MNEGCGVGFLLIHGFIGGPWDLKPLTVFLQGKGWETEVPVLRGHGEGRNNLRGVDWREWVEDVEASYDKLSRRCSDIVVIGYSMGGLLGTHVVLRKRVHAVVYINTPIYCLNFRTIVENIFKGLSGGNSTRLRKYIRNCVATPPGAVLQFSRLMKRMRGKMEGVDVPVLIVQGLEDDTVQPRSARYIFDQVQSPVKRLYIIPKMGHLITGGDFGEEVCCAVAEFLEKTPVGAGNKKLEIE